MKDWLTIIYNQLGLEQLAAEDPRSGFILISTGKVHGRHNQFYPEELFLFLIVKCKTGMCNKCLGNYLFGGMHAIGASVIGGFLGIFMRDTTGLFCMKS